MRTTMPKSPSTSSSSHDEFTHDFPNDSQNTRPESGQVPPPPPPRKKKLNEPQANDQAASDPIAATAGTGSTETEEQKLAKKIAQAQAASDSVNATPVQSPVVKPSSADNKEVGGTPASPQKANSCQKAWGIALATLGSVCTAGSAITAGLLLNTFMASSSSFTAAVTSMYNAYPIVTISLAAAFVVGAILIGVGAHMIKTSKAGTFKNNGATPTEDDEAKAKAEAEAASSTTPLLSQENV